MKKFLSSAAMGVVIAASMISPAFATDVSVNVNAHAKQTVDIACVKTALDVRESALMTAWGKYNTSVTAAYSARLTALDAAWVMTDAKARTAAIKTAWNTFAASKKAAQKQWNTDRKAAWATFRASAKVCKVANVDVGGEAMDQ